jgi:hypothetical protein
MGKKTSSKSEKERYTAYKSQNKAEINKLKKLERHLKKHPNDKQSELRDQVKYGKNHQKKLDELRSDFERGKYYLQNLYYKDKK